MDEPVFLSRERVLHLHQLSLQEHGGLSGLREPGLLDSALMQPEAACHYAQGDLPVIAAAYAFHIAQNQPFIDGNKRTGITCALAFLELNGISTSALTDAELYDAMIGIAEKRLDKAGLAGIFRQCLPTG